MELGVFSLTDIYPGSPDTAASRIDDIIGYGILAEQYGLDVFGIGEHHTRAFAVSSPVVVHAAIAGRPAGSRLPPSPSPATSTSGTPTTRRCTTSTPTTTGTYHPKPTAAAASTSTATR